MEALLTLMPAGMQKAFEEIPKERLEGAVDLEAEFGGEMPPLLRQQLDQAKRRKRPKFAAEDVGDLLDLGKEWHGIHFLLCGSAAEAGPPLGNAILGGTEIGKDRGYGPARYLDVPVGKEVADALARISVEDFESRYDSAVLETNQIYPGGWSDPSMMGLLSNGYAGLRAFYALAAEREFAVIIGLQ